MVPVPQHAEAAEGGLLDVDPLAGKFLGAAADFRGAEAAGFLDDFEFDGQAMAVPAGDVGRLEAGHGLRFEHKVLDDFVEGGAHMDVAIGEGRAIVEEEPGRTLGLTAGLDFLIETGAFPGGETGRLAQDQVRLHGKVGLRQVDGVLVVGGGSAHGIGEKGARRLPA